MCACVNRKIPCNISQQFSLIYRGFQGGIANFIINRVNIAFQQVPVAFYYILNRQGEIYSNQIFFVQTFDSLKCANSVLFFTLRMSSYLEPACIQEQSQIQCAICKTHTRGSLPLSVTTSLKANPQGAPPGFSYSRTRDDKIASACLGVGPIVMNKITSL